MKDPEREKFLSSLKPIGKKSALEALNFMLIDPKYISSSRRHFYLSYFVQEKITEVIIVDTQKLRQFEIIRRTGRKDNEVVPHSRITEDFLDILIKAKQNSDRNSFFDYQRNQLLLFADGKTGKAAEKILRQMGLRIIFFNGALS